MIKMSLLYKGAIDFCYDQAYLTRVDKSADSGLFRCWFFGFLAFFFNFKISLTLIRGLDWWIISIISNNFCISLTFLSGRVSTYLIWQSSKYSNKRCNYEVWRHVLINTYVEHMPLLRSLYLLTMEWFGIPG